MILLVAPAVFGLALVGCVGPYFTITRVSVDYNLPQTYRFDASSSQGETYYWWFGDGSESDVPTENPVAEHTYDEYGEYEVTVGVTYPEGMPTYYTRTLVVEKGLQADVVADPAGGLVPVTVHFDGTASRSSHADDPIAKYEWDYYGDGNFVEAGPTVDHTYGEEGIFTAKLRVTTVPGTVDVAEKLIYLGTNRFGHAFDIAFESDGDMVVTGGEGELKHVDMHDADRPVTTLVSSDDFFGSPDAVDVSPTNEILFSTVKNTGSGWRVFVRKMDVEGNIITIAGTGNNCPHDADPAQRPLDGAPATEATLCGVNGIAAGDSGEVYISDGEWAAVYVIQDDGKIYRIAGSGDTEEGWNGDGPARERLLFLPSGIDVAPDGSVYVADSGNGRVRRITGTGLSRSIATVAGNNGADYENDVDGVPATDVPVPLPLDVAVAHDGSGTFLVVQGQRRRVRVVGEDGIIHGAGGRRGEGPYPPAAAFQPADTSVFVFPHRVEWDPSGEAWFTEGLVNGQHVPRPIGLSIPPQANLSVTSLNRSTVRLGGWTSFDLDGQITQFKYEFGDGSAPAYGIGPVTHAYEENGTYQVSLTVTDNTGLINQHQGQVSIEPNQPPVAQLTIWCLYGGGVYEQPYCPEQGAFIFDPADSYDPDGEITGWDYAYGDGNRFTTDNSDPVFHTYPAPGQYVGTFGVVDDEEEATVIEFGVWACESLCIPPDG